MPPHQPVNQAGNSSAPNLLAERDLPQKALMRLPMHASHPELEFAHPRFQLSLSQCEVSSGKSTTCLRFPSD